MENYLVGARFLTSFIDFPDSVVFLFLFPSQTLSLHRQSGPKDLITVTVELLHNSHLGGRRKWPL